LSPGTGATNTGWLKPVPTRLTAMPSLLSVTVIAMSRVELSVPSLARSWT